MKVARHALFASLALSVVVSAAAWAADRAKAEASLKEAVKKGDAAKVTEACDELIESGGKESVTAILKLAEKVEGGVYWQLVGGASGFKDRGALEELGKFIASASGGAKAGLARDLVFGLQNNQSSYVAVPLGIVLEKGKYDLQLMAVDQLAQTRSIESLDALIAAFKREQKGDAELRSRIEKALVNLTGENFGDPGNWEGWWKEQRSKGVPERKGGSGAGGTMEKPRDQDFKKTVERAPKKGVIVLAAHSNEGSEEERKPEQNDFDYDHMEQVLEQLKIPHTVVKRKSFEADPQKYLKDCYALLINCHQINKQCVCKGCTPVAGGPLTNRMSSCNPACGKHEERSYRLNQGALDAIKAWVEKDGGYLYTEDWGLVETVQTLWPDKVTTGNGADKPRLVRKKKEDNSGYYPHIDCKLNPAKGNTSHPLMRGVWQKPKKDEAPKPAEPAAAPGGTVSRDNSPAQPIKHKWQVDDESPAIEIKDRSNVIPLLESEDLGQYTDGNQTVAITFRVGSKVPEKPKQATGGAAGKDRGTGEWSTQSKGGRVLHTMSHFGHQGGDDDGQALYNLMANFLLEAAKRHDPNGGQ